MKFNLFFLLVFLASTLALTSCENEEQAEFDRDLAEAVDRDTPTPDSNSSFSLAVSGLTSSDSSVCWAPDFPLTFVLADGTEEVAFDEESLGAILSNEENPPVALGYPINLVDPATGSTTTAADEDEFIALLSDCDLIDDGDTPPNDDDTNPPYDTTTFDSAPIVYELSAVSLPLVFADTVLNDGNSLCFTYDYPVSLVLADDTEVSADTDDELLILLTENGDVGNIAGFVYPIGLTRNDDGTQLTAHNDEEVRGFLDECGD